MAQSKPPDELAPLREMCRQGRLFEVQDWIRSGKPITPDSPPPKNARNSPLCIAISRGFHSLVKILLEAGAPIQEGGYNALNHAVQLRRPDLVALLLENGGKVQDVSMHDAIATWQREMVELLLAHGANLVRGNPIAWGLINKIRPTLGLLKKYAKEQPELLKQADIALRHHAREGDVKWVSLALWAAADPWARGPDEAPDWEQAINPVDDDEEEQYYWNAVEAAVIFDRTEVLQRTKLVQRPDPKRPESLELLAHANFVRFPSTLQFLLDKGHTPDLLPDHGSELISQLVCSMNAGRHGCFRGGDVVEMVGALVSRGARWRPEDEREIKYVRKALSSMEAKHIVSFLEIMTQHQAARRTVMEDLLRTPKMKELLRTRKGRVANLVAGLPLELPSVGG